MARHLRTAAGFGVFVPFGVLAGALTGAGGLNGAIIGGAGGFAIALILTGLAPAEWRSCIYPSEDEADRRESRGCPMMFAS